MSAEKKRQNKKDTCTETEHLPQVPRNLSFSGIPTNKGHDTLPFRKNQYICTFKTASNINKYKTKKLKCKTKDLSE
ncbi:MAG TPA: hypothetical protein PLN34_01255 [Alloprevotella sp.]|nr:hypothetical protein [Alloprevotella sp.]